MKDSFVGGGGMDSLCPTPLFIILGVMIEKGASHGHEKEQKKH
jgi:hypothetical protein